MSLLFMTGNATAQEVSPEVEESVATIKQKNFEFRAEARAFDSSPEFIFGYKNFSLDYIRAHDDFNFLKLKMDKEIFSLMGTGLEWNVALNAVDAQDSFYMLPSVGINFYMRIRPRLDVYMQFSGLTLGRFGHFSDFETGFKYFPQKNFSISAGWRRNSLQSRRSHFVLSGPFAGVRYDF